VLLADEFFWLAHSDRTGRPLLHDRAAGVGLAAALVAELVFSGHVVVWDGHLHIRDRMAPRDVLAHSILEQVIGEARHGHSVGTWLSFLAQDAYRQVGERLWRAGQVRQLPSRRLLSRAVVYVPVDVNVAAWPTARLATRLSQQLPQDPFDVFLTGLVVATELHGQVLLDAPPDSHEHVRRVAASNPPQVRELLHHTEAAIGNAVLSHRT
jgi:hypothetical protein